MVEAYSTKECLAALRRLAGYIVAMHERRIAEGNDSMSEACSRRGGLSVWAVYQEGISQPFQC